MFAEVIRIRDERLAKCQLVTPVHRQQQVDIIVDFVSLSLLQVTFSLLILSMT